MLGSESALLKAGAHPSNKLLALSVHRQWQGASSLGWQPGQLLLQNRWTAQVSDSVPAVQTLHSSLPAQTKGLFLLQKGEDAHTWPSSTLETICSLHTLTAEQERWAPVSM